MKFKKHFLLTVISFLLITCGSFGVILKPALFNSTAVAQSVSDRKAEADRLVEQGIKQYRASQLKQALQFWEQSLAIYREIGNREGIAGSLNNLGNAYDNLGDYRKAIDYHQQSLEIAKQICNRRGIANSL